MFCAGGIATPADAALMMQLGAEGNFVGSGIFKSEDPERTAKAIVEATTHFDDAERVAAASRGLGRAMAGIEISELEARTAAACSRTAVGSRASAYSPSRAGSRRTPRCSPRSAPTRAGSARPPTSKGSTA